MTPEYFTIGKDWSVQTVLNHIRENGESSETLDILYIVDEKGLLIDDIKIGEINSDSKNHPNPDLPLFEAIIATIIAKIPKKRTNSTYVSP